LWQKLTGKSKEELKDLVAKTDNYKVLSKGDIADIEGMTESEQPEEEYVIDEAAICKAGKDWVDGKTIGGQKVKRVDGKFKNWSARAAQIASKYCKVLNYGRGGKEKKDESIAEAASSSDGGLRKWGKEKWVHSDGTPCGGGEADGSNSRCKPKASWANMSQSEKDADNAKKRRATDSGEQYSKSDHPVTNKQKKRSREKK